MVSRSSGSLLRDARTRAGLTQAELAERAGTTQSVISAYEHDRRQPALSTLADLVSATGLELEVTVRAQRRPIDRLTGPLGSRVRRHRRRLVEVAGQYVGMGVLGFGVGSFSAAVPGVILAATLKSETSSAMSFNYVVRSVGFSLGSAIGGLVLAAGTKSGHRFPTDHAYTTAAFAGMAAMAIAAISSVTLARLPVRKTEPNTTPPGDPEPPTSKT